jgi:folate-binding protein YgfZ
MVALALRSFHHELGAVFIEVRGMEVVGRYGDWQVEHRALRSSAGVLDLSARTRLVLLGADRHTMLNGQVTNNVRDLKLGSGCYAALVNAKARMLSDLNIYALPEELLLDGEPGLSTAITARLEKFILAADVRVVDAAPHYGLFSVQGPKTPSLLEALEWLPALPGETHGFVEVAHPRWGLLYLMNHPRVGNRGADLFVPQAALPAVMERLVVAAHTMGGRVCGWDALEAARVEAGIPRYGIDMDETNLPVEAGLEERAIRYDKGCYIGQEVIARIRTYGQVAKALRGLELGPAGSGLPAPRTRLFKDGRDVGYTTSAVYSPFLQLNIALGYVRKECNAPATELAVGSADAAAKAVIVPLPFVDRLFA